MGTPCFPVRSTRNSAISNVLLPSCISGCFLCPSFPHIHAEHTCTSPAPSLSYQPSIAVTSCYNKTETPKQCVVTSDYCSTDTSWTSGKCDLADTVKFFICGWETKVEWGQNSWSGERPFYSLWVHTGKYCAFISWAPGTIWGCFPYVPIPKQCH